jgi:tetratricopeptide (TPR) repeat protein
MLQPPSKADDPLYVAPTDPIAPLRVALRNRYDIEREIGQGAFATVYLAHDLKHERKVALKVLNADPTSEMGEIRFIREIRMLASLQHPNILPLHDSGHVEALLYYVMPYVAGETLRARIDRERQLPIDAACRIARDAADALGYAHAQGIIHRDIKPENILLSGNHPILADFGIARAIDLGGVRQLTRTGMNSPGTPAYMSPEQLLGDSEVDGRSDTYSLGCVLYEMLVGKPPFAGKDGFVKRFTESAPSARAARHEIPGWMDDVVAKALARNPSARFTTAEDLVEALRGPERGITTRERIPVEPTHREIANGAEAKKLPAMVPQAASPGVSNAANAADAATVAGPPRVGADAAVAVLARNKGVAVATAIILVLGVGAFGTPLGGRVASALGFSGAVDDSRIAVLPIAGSGSIAVKTHVSDALYAAVTEWRGLSVASDQDVHEAMSSASVPSSTHAAAQLARSLRAGRFIWGRVSRGDESNVRVELYDLEHESPLSVARIPAASNSTEIAQAVRILLRMPDRPRAADGGDGRTTSFPAWNAYARGHAQLQKGNLDSAERAFREAANADPEFGPARVWMAQIAAWKTPTAPDDWLDEASGALRSKSGLDDRDRLIALALTRMASKRFADACTAYSSLKQIDSTDFTALFGLGQCQALDSLVVPSTSSPSGWAFRSRYSAAADSYMKALAVNGNAHSILSFDHLQELLPTATTKTRRGRNAANEEFAAYPALISDTAVFVPYPIAAFGRLSARQTAATQAAAIERNLGVLRDFAVEWTHREPRNAAGYRALSHVLEAGGELNRRRSTTMSALEAMERARILARTPYDTLMARSDLAWLHFKNGNFRAARVLADSIVLTLKEPSPDQSAAAIGLAALTGRIGVTTDLSKQLDYSSSLSHLPIPVMDAAAAFFAFSTLGVCGDSTARLERVLDEQINRYIAEDRQPQVNQAVKARPVAMLGPCTHGKSSLELPAGGNRVLQMQQLLARSDKRALITALASLTEDGRAQRPGDVSLDFTYQVAWLRVESGDTLGATRQLDRVLGALPSVSANSLRDPASAASAVRAMILRADLATAAGDTDAADRWARGVLELWANADAPLNSTRARMKVLTSLSRK